MICFRFPRYSTDRNPSQHSITTPYQTCEICFESLLVTYSPISAAILLPSCHSVSVSCALGTPILRLVLGKYIKEKLYPSGTGDMNTHTLAFPIRCPDCPITQQREALIRGGIAEKVSDREAISALVSNLQTSCVLAC